MQENYKNFGAVYKCDTCGRLEKCRNSEIPAARIWSYCESCKCDEFHSTVWHDLSSKYRTARYTCSDCDECREAHDYEDATFSGIKTLFCSWCNRRTTHDFVKEIVESVETKNDEAVSHPSHYTQGKVECIEAIESALGTESFRDHCVATALTYLWRWRHKNGLQDVQKAQWYIDRMLKTFEEK